MRIKINGILSESELKGLVECGIDEIGIFVGQLHQSPLFILPSTAARLISMLPPGIYPVLDTHFSDCDTIRELVDKTGIFTVQLHCWEPEEVLKLRDELPHYAKIILTYYLDTPTYPLVALDPIYPAIDAVTLDCLNREPGVPGEIPGFPNWENAARILNQIPVPLWISGGLGPENVAAAIKLLRPFGIESGVDLRENGVLDFKRCRNLVDQARAAAIEYKL